MQNSKPQTHLIVAIKVPAGWAIAKSQHPKYSRISSIAIGEISKYRNCENSKLGNLIKLQKLIPRVWISKLQKTQLPETYPNCINYVFGGELRNCKIADTNKYSEIAQIARIKFFGDFKIATNHILGNCTRTVGIKFTENQKTGAAELSHFTRNIAQVAEIPPGVKKIRFRINF